MKPTLRIFNYSPRTNVYISPQHSHLAHNLVTLWTGASSHRQSHPRKPLPLKNHSHPLKVFDTPALSITSTTSAPMPANQIPPAHSPTPETWMFNFASRELSTAAAGIQLTAIESLLIKTLMLNEARICSKQELISGIDKDVSSYRCLEMCLSRLQNKFKDAFGERLFRSVRNRGYCLVQDVKSAQ